MEKLNIAIADDNEYMLKLLDEIISNDEELEVIGRAKNGEDAYEIIKNKEPDIVLLDLIMPKMDGLGVMEKVNNDPSMKKYPSFIIISAAGHDRLTEDAFRLGADYYIMKPFDHNNVIAQIKHSRIYHSQQNKKSCKILAYENQTEYANRNIETDVTNLLNAIGIPTKFNGYHFLRDGIILSVQDKEMLTSITKILYPAIAKKHGTTDIRVERSIRHAIDATWKKGVMRTVIRQNGYTIDLGKEKPTNYTFISLITDKLRLIYNYS